MPDPNNRSWDMLVGKLVRIETKLDTVLERTARHAEQIAGQGKSVRWLFGVLAGIIVWVIASEITHRK